MTSEEKKELTRQRTAAVRESLQQEREYVSEGKGTREWTQDQQKDILSGERPKDENGKSYEGHHMKSVSGHEVQASNKNNIQWLSRAEHKAAHEGNFHIKTNGRYDPETGETESFRRYPVAPEVKSLKNPINQSSEQSKVKTETIEQFNTHGR